MIQTKIFLLLIGFLIVPSVTENVFAENMPVQIEITYPNGDRASLSDSKLIITSQDGKINQELLGKSSEPYFTTELSVDKRYEMLVFVNDMFAGTKYLTFDDKTNPLIKIPINPSVGMKFYVYFEDGITPIRNALLELYSHNGNLIKSIQTDADGKTLRLWVASTIAEEDHYRAKVSISNNLVYESTEIRLNSGSEDFDIVTNWPKTVDFIKIHTNLKQYDYYSSDKNYVAKVYDDALEKSASIVRETAHIPKLMVGEFQVLIFEENTPTKILANQTILIDDNYGEYSIPILEYAQQESDALNHAYLDGVDSNSLDFYNDFENLNWIKQSMSGNQSRNNDSEVFLQLETEGNGNSVFTRSTFDETDLNDKEIKISYVVDNPLSLEQLWIYFSHDDFESWYTFKIPISDVLQGKLTTTTFDISESNITGEPDPSLVNQVQIRIKDKASDPVKLQLVDFYVLDSNKTNTVSGDDTHPNLPNCNCVAFRLDDIQDFFLTDIQMELVETFQKNDVDLTVGIIANNIGRDIEMMEFVKKLVTDSGIEFANHGWDHEDFSQFGTVGQEMLLLRSNDKLSEMFGVSPKVFIPPQNAYNSDTISALHAQRFTHFSSELDFATPPFPLSEQTLYHFPETAYTGDLNEQRTRFEGVSADFTFNQINDSLSEYGFAVVTLHPQEFAQYYNNQYQDKVNYQQIEQLELLFEKISENNIDTVMISEINTQPNKKQLVPQWVKNNAEWWIDERVSTEEFVNSLEFLIDQKIIIVSDTEPTSQLTNIPDWVKTNIQWWTEGQTSDSEFISAAEFLIRNGIIQI